MTIFAAIMVADGRLVTVWRLKILVRHLKIDARGQMVTPQLENKIKLQIVTKSNGILSVDDVRIIRK